MTTVTQADREAAAGIVGPKSNKGKYPGFACDYREGRCDTSNLVQAFAAHREAAFEAGAKAMQWQDIATAPMDGTWIITAKVGWHHSSDRIKIEIWDQPKNRYDVWHCSRAQFNGRYWTDGVERLVEPTHWMPLETPEPLEGPQGCAVPPLGWYCTREAGHEGPCAAIPTAAALDPAQIAGGKR